MVENRIYAALLMRQLAERQLLLSILEMHGKTLQNLQDSFKKDQMRHIKY
jgi:hypothetical protein